MKTATVTKDGAPGWAAYVCTDQGAEIARATLDRLGAAEGALRGGGLSGAARVCGGAPLARRVLAEIGNIPVPMACESVTELRRSGAEVILLGQASDLGTYRALRQAGALDYFAFPVTPDEILALLDAGPANTASAPAPRGRVVAVTGSTGGTGASLLAQNLAFHAARGKGDALQTALVDADLLFGTQSATLDQAGTPGLVEALSAPDRVDATFLDATMTRLNDRLALYAHQLSDPAEADRLTAALPRLVTPLRGTFPAVVLDLPRGVLLRQPQIAGALDALVLVLPPGFAGVNAACRLMARASAAAPGLRVLPVLSDLRRDAALGRKELEGALGRPLAATLPRCDSLVTRAERSARALVETQPRSPYARAVRDLWQRLAQTPAAEAPKRRKGLFG